MTILLIIVAIAAAIYIFAAFAYYYGFKNRYSLCGCKVTECSPKRTIVGWNLEGLVFRCETGLINTRRITMFLQTLSGSSIPFLSAPFIDDPA